MLHAGVVPVHALAFVAVQATHVFVAVLHAGVVPEHCPSATHCTHDPGPLEPLHTPPLHGVPGLAEPHVPVEQLLQVRLHAALQQTRPTHSLVVH